jgi:hypothetical protein
MPVPQELIDRICARCVEVGECLEWHGCLSGKGQIYVSFGGTQFLVRRVLWESLHGAPPNGKMIAAACGNKLCVRHLKAITWSQKNKRDAKQRKASHRLNVAAARRKNSKLSDEAVARVRSHVGGLAALAAELGISETYAYQLRNNQCRRDLSNPFAGLFTGLVAANESTSRTAA